MITSIVVATLLVAVGAGTGAGCGLGHPDPPIITYYAPVPIWFPKYIGPHYSDYLVIRYTTPPDVSAMIVKQRILTINAANPALLPAPKQPETLPKPNTLPAQQKKE